MTRLVLFDIDGTLIDTGGAGQKAFGVVCEKVYGVQNATAELQFAGQTDSGIVRQFFTRHHIQPSPEEFQRFFAAYLQTLPRLLQATAGRVLPAVEPWLSGLSALSRPPAVGLLTGNIRLGAQAKLRHYGLWHHFGMGAFGDDHENRNEVAKVALARARELGHASLKGEEIWVIGDTPLDIACARAIGAKVLAVATGLYSAAQLKDLNPDCLVSDLTEITPDRICE